MTDCSKKGCFRYDYVRLPLDRQIGLHSQESWELDYILTGRGVRTTGSRSEHFREGEVVLVPPGIPHCWEFDPAHTDYGGNIVNITVTFDDLFLDSVLGVFPDLLKSISYIRDRRNSVISYVGDTLNRLVSLMRGMNDEDAAARAGSFLKILGVLGSNPEARQSDNCLKVNSEEKRKMKVRTFVSCNISRPVTLKEISSYVGMNESAFCIFFRKQYGQTFVEYLNSQRLEYARHLLENGSLTVTEVCYACGFSSPPYFSRIFRREVGISPQQYAKSISGNKLTIPENKNTDIMKINHVALYCNDLEGMKHFFETYFRAESNSLYHNPRTGLSTYILTFPDRESRLEIMTRPEVEGDNENMFRAGFIHLSFSVGSRESVDALTSRLEADGYQTLSGPRTTGDGYYESCVRGFEGILLEITV